MNNINSDLILTQTLGVFPQMTLFPSRYMQQLANFSHKNQMHKWYTNKKWAYNSTYFFLIRDISEEGSGEPYTQDTWGKSSIGRGHYKCVCIYMFIIYMYMYLECWRSSKKPGVATA